MDQALVVTLIVLNALSLSVSVVGLWMSWQTQAKWAGLLVALRNARRR